MARQTHAGATVYGRRLACADEVLSLAEPPPAVAGLPVVFPIPAPGWVQPIATPRWPSDLAAHMSPLGVIAPRDGGTAGFTR
ncbi:MAG: hypothetical protein E6J41_07870 [Chloroflexi bacterium]|nr:MAG: hypothetical protein E6J41_07870 [Chloroflexota bacterium]